MCVKKSSPQHIDIRIDKLTNSIVNTISGDSFLTEVTRVSTSDIKRMNNTQLWQFDWHQEVLQKQREVVKLYIQGNPRIIQGLASISNEHDHFHVHLIESAPFNIGKHKLYEGVPGNLFAYACKRSLDNGYDGIVAFNSKTALKKHYENVLGATPIGGQRMVLFPPASHKLIKKYYTSEI